MKNNVLAPQLPPPLIILSHLLYFKAKAFMTLRCMVSKLLTGNEYLLLLELGSSDGLISNGEANDSPLAITSSSVMNGTNGIYDSNVLEQINICVHNKN